MPSPEAPDSLSATTCEQCREQHLRCDRVLPICGRCLMTGRECKKGYKFRAPKHAVFRESHKWPAPPKKLKFIDETRGVELGEDLDSNESVHDSAPDVDEVGTEATTEVASTSPGTATVVDSTVSDDQRRPSIYAAKAASWPLPGDESRPGAKSVVDGGDVVDEPVQPPHRISLSTPGADNHSQHGSHREHSGSVVSLPPVQSMLPPLEGIYTDRPIWPIQGRKEATLFRHYVDKLGFWLDACDPSRHFEVEVPQRAGSCPILLNAIFALASRHLSLTSAYDSLASNRYHEQCLNYLIPLLDHAGTVSDENLFAATIILRVLEEIDVNTLGQDTHGHLLGIHAFVNAGDRFLMPGTLTAACFWAGLRQEIYSAVINQQVVRMNLGHAIVDRSTTPADDFVWANRAIVHCADVLNFCFGSEAGSVLQWGQLEMANREWKNALPPSYTPIFFRERTDEEAFPEVWYQKACHIIAVQHHILAEMYLVLFNPSIPRVGGGRKAAEKRLTQQIQDLLRSLCGIGMCNQWSPPAMFTACMGIAIAGDRFDTKHDQEALLKMLSITEKAHARPTTAVRDQLMHAWGWMDGEAMNED
ncbi:arca-like protein [Colletotrichum scovillei]|uniref:Arca-like protein n=2 Tax=Colletotrichum scovillei TaxID=1209932 RepID=A0A9P7RGN2_9PEZI|nr:arca-like protein [Colletotrichum scovillei]KAG7075499.1 arca-like protein [Colletotrichum scovillei]KAG7082649.1 arca-like protein [Colletotrichum scovillei]